MSTSSSGLWAVVLLGIPDAMQASLPLGKLGQWAVTVTDDQDLLVSTAWL
jgi:hypothetical protein